LIVLDSLRGRFSEKVRFPETERAQWIRRFDP
jgi:hypothetical protein